MAQRGYILALLVGLVAAVYGFRLGAVSLWDIDEAIYADISRNMAATGDWVMPVFNGGPRFDKPPLLLWVGAGAMKLFGPGEAQARLGSWLFAVLGVALIGAMGRRMFSPRAGLFAALVLASTLGWFLEGRIGLLDTGLSFFVALAVYCFYRFDQVRTVAHSVAARAWMWVVWMWGALALGVLTKGPVAVVLVGATIFLYLGWRRFWSFFLSRWTLVGLGLFALVAGPWHLAIYRRAGWAWVEEYFGYHMLRRFTTPLEAHGYDWYFYAPVLAAALLPWTAYVLLAGWDILRRWRSSGPERLLGWWFLVVFVFFSVSRTKLPGYILPALPPLALLVGAWFDRGLQWRRPITRLLRAGLWASVALGVLGAAGLAALRPQVPAEYLGAYRLLFWVPASLVAGMLLTGLAYRLTGSPAVLVHGFGVTALAALLFVGGWLVPVAAAQRPVKALALAASRYLRPGVRVVSAMGDASTTFYTGTRVLYLLTPDEVKAALSDATRPTLALVPQSLLPQLSASIPDLVVLEQAGFGALVTRSAMAVAR